MRKNYLVLAVFLMLFLLIIQGQPAYAVGPYNPIADAYTYLPDPTLTFGLEPYLILTASNIDVCVPSSYVWFKFQVPNPTATIASATLSVPLDPHYLGDEKLDMELRSSSVTDWDEATINWENQPALDAEVLATAPSAVAPNDVLFMGTLANYLNGKKGQIVSLVVKANCNGNIFFDAGRLIASRENTEAEHKVELILQGPTDVRLVEIRGGNAQANQAVITIGVLLGLLGAMMVVGRIKAKG